MRNKRARTRARRTMMVEMGLHVHQDLHPGSPVVDARGMEHHQHETQRPRQDARVATRPDSTPAFAVLLFGLLLIAGLLLL